jgi:TldD protein
VVDDGTLPDRRGSLNIDDEGNPTQRTVLIEDGILTGYMQDMMNARLMGVPVRPATAAASPSPTCRCRA